MIDKLRNCELRNWGIITNDNILQFGIPKFLNSQIMNFDEFIKSPSYPLTVIPAKAGHVVTRSEASALTFSAIQSFQVVADHLDSGLSATGTVFTGVTTFYEIITFGCIAYCATRNKRIIWWHRRIVSTYEDDFAKYARHQELALLQRTFQLIPRQVGRSSNT